jgi:hypothetical protein
METRLENVVLVGILGDVYMIEHHVADRAAIAVDLAREAGRWVDSTQGLVGDWSTGLRSYGSGAMNPDRLHAL